MARTLFILNDAPYDTERGNNASGSWAPSPNARGFEGNSRPDAAISR